MDKIKPTNIGKTNQYEAGRAGFGGSDEIGGIIDIDSSSFYCLTQPLYDT